MVAHFVEYNKTSSQHCIQSWTLSQLKTYQFNGKNIEKYHCEETDKGVHPKHNIKNINHKPNNYEWAKVKDIW